MTTVSPCTIFILIENKHKTRINLKFKIVTNISLFLLVLLNTLQLATGATYLFSQGVTAVVHGCSIHALDPSGESSHTAGGVAIGIHLCLSCIF